jgi:hypothetical protein
MIRIIRVGQVSYLPLTKNMAVVVTYEITSIQVSFKCVLINAATLIYIRSLERWDRGSESHSKHRYLVVFILCLCQVVALRQADPPTKESYRLS